MTAIGRWAATSGLTRRPVSGAGTRTGVGLGLGVGLRLAAGLGLGVGLGLAVATAPGWPERAATGSLAPGLADGAEPLAPSATIARRPTRAMMPTPASSGGLMLWNTRWLASVTVPSIAPRGRRGAGRRIQDEASLRGVGW